MVAVYQIIPAFSTRTDSITSRCGRSELWGMSYPEPYLTLYNTSAAAIKAVSPRLRVGGPATAALAHVADFLADTKRLNLPIDFVSTHSCETAHSQSATTPRRSYGCG